MIQPGRSYSAGTAYRYGFNGKENDNEVSGEGNKLDYEARILDSRLGRWMSIDPEAKKFPAESPYIYSSNSPILFYDPDGEEKIVATGGADLHNKNRMNFITASKIVLKKYIEQVKKAGNNETVTWVIFDFDYTDAEKKSFEKWAKNNGVAPPVYVKTTENLVNYINNKDISSPLDVGGTPSIDRTNDKITSLSFAAHGVESIVAFGLENTDPVANDQVPGKYTIVTSDFTIENAQTLNENAFDNCVIDFYSCNPATAYTDYENYENSGGADNYLRAHDFTSVQELKDFNKTNPNLVQTLAEVTKSKVTGNIGTCNYTPVGSGKLPTPGKTLQTVNGKKIKAIPVTVDKRQTP